MLGHVAARGGVTTVFEALSAFAGASRIGHSSGENPFDGFLTRKET